MSVASFGIRIGVRRLSWWHTVLSSQVSHDTELVFDVVKSLHPLRRKNQLSDGAHYKDESLDRLALFGNVAQFVSFDPDLRPRFSRVADFEPNHRFDGPRTAINTLIEKSPEHKLNIRTFSPDRPQGNEFIYGLEETGRIVSELNRFSGQHLYTIVNETVDVNDGGVSGVTQGSVIEFAPGGTPRVVDNARAASMSRDAGIKMLERVYGFTPDLEFEPALRVEFSIHPRLRGWKKEHTILWEIEELPYQVMQPTTNWPNDFSEFLGDKVFGLLVAISANCHVPSTCVLSRRLPPFCFGEDTGSDVKWIRTCPRIPRPGRFTTVRGWTDPFKLLASEDPQGTEIPSVLIQNEVKPIYSGALLTGREGEAIIEGVPGYGDALMLGRANPSTLPRDVLYKLKDLHSDLVHGYGSLRLEWVHDGNRVWVVQLQQEPATSSGTIIVEGPVDVEIEFQAAEGLDRLRTLVNSLRGSTKGIRLMGNVGMTSHMADILRRAGIPSRLLRPHRALET
jgi:hypothetical protein